MKNILKHKRMLRNLSQEQLAKIVGVSRQTIISIETGKFNPSIELAYKIAKTFDCIIEDIFLFNEEGK